MGIPENFAATLAPDLNTAIVSEHIVWQAWTVRSIHDIQVRWQ